MVFFNPAIDIALIAFCLAIVSQVIQRKFMDKNQLKEHQSKIKLKQERMKELMKKNDGHSKSELEKLEIEMLELSNAMLKNSMRMMMVSMAVMLPAFWLIGTLYESVVINLPFAVPVIHRNLSFELTSRISWLWFYIYAGMISSMLLNGAINILEKKGILKKTK